MLSLCLVYVCMSVVFEKNGKRRVSCRDKRFLFTILDGRADQSGVKEVHGESVPSLKTVCFLINECKHGRNTTGDEP